MPIKEKMTLGEWDVEIKKHSLHLKYDSQLFFLEESIEAKIPRVNRDLIVILFFPDAKKKEICESYIESGEITNYFDMETPVPISLEDQKRIDGEYQHELSFYTAKLSWLKEKLTCCLKEMELRADGLVVRKPKGTKYYIDFTNGHDVNNDGSTPVKSNGDGPFATCDKYTSIAAAGDIGIGRRGMVQAVSQDLTFADDGTIVAPIILEADFDDAWGDETVAGQTATLTFGSKTVTFAGDISGDIAAHDWIYESTEDNREFAYEVASISGGSNEIVTLYLPYKGAISGAGKTINIMPDNPIWNIAAGDYEVNIDGDNYWKFQGLHCRGTDINGVVELDTSNGTVFKDLIFEGNGSGDYGLKGVSSSDAFEGEANKCRFYNYYIGIQIVCNPISFAIRDCLFDGNSVASSRGIYGNSYTLLPLLTDCEFKNHTVGDIVINKAAFILYGRNLLLSSATEIDLHDTRQFCKVFIEDYEQTIGDNRQFTGFSTAEGTPSIQSETTKVRAGGGASSIKVTPSDKLGSAWELSRILVHSGKVHALKDVGKTLTAYLSSDDDTDWDADPLAGELYMRVYFWGHATNVHRKMLQSTEVCNNFNADDAVWDSISCTFTPLQTGVVYFEVWYCKTKEAGNSNIFYCDTKVPPT